MRRWSTGGNNYYYTSIIFLEEAPWYVFFLDTVISWICHYFPRIPLPKIKIIRDNEETNLKEYYGDTSHLFHIYVCSPISDWCWEKTKSEQISFPYQMCSQMFPKDFERYPSNGDCENDEWKIKKENITYSRKVGDMFMVLYRDLQKIGEVRMNEIKEKEKNKENANK